MADEDDYIDLAEIIAAVWRHRLVFVLCLALGLAAAVAAYKILPAKWRANATLQIGQVPDLTNTTSRQTALIEPAAQLAEKLQLHDQEILAQAGFKPEQYELPPAKLLRDTLNATQVKNTNLVQISVAGFSAEEAERNMRAVTEVVLKEHRALFVPTLNRLTAQLEENARQIPQAQAARKEAQAVLDQAEAARSSTQFAPAVLAMQLIENKDAELRKLEEERLALEELAAPAKTFMTEVVGRIKVENAAYFPNLALFLALGLFLGFLLAAAIVIVREWQRKQAPVA